MRKTITAGKGKAQAWFDAEYRESRKDLRHHLRKYHQGNTDYEKLQYNQKRREYKELLRVKKEQRTVKKYWTLYTGRVQTQQKSGASLSHI